MSNGVTVQGNYAYVADSTYGLFMVDVSNPAAATLKGQYAGLSAQNVAVAGNYAYVTDYTFGLVIVDVTNRQSPF